MWPMYSHVCSHLSSPDAAPGGVEGENSGSPPPGDRAVGEGYLFHDTLQLNHTAAVVVLLLHLVASLVHHACSRLCQCGEGPSKCQGEWRAVEREAVRQEAQVQEGVEEDREGSG